MYFIYQILTAFSMIFLAPYYALRTWRRGEGLHTLGERLGRLPPEIAGRVSRDGPDGTSHSGAIWIHAVSVGEVLAAKPLAQALKHRFRSRVVLVSTTTETGQRLARERLAFTDGIFYFPLDWAVSVRRALRAIRPALVIVMETEIWPNFLRQARLENVPVIFANARISEKSFGRYQRWQFLVGPFYARVLADVELFLAQTQEDATRLAEMGAAEDRIEVTGNLKYDSEPPDVSRFGVWLEGEIQRQERWPVIVAGSVVQDEEEAVLAGYDIVQRRWRRALLILAPRKPDRFDQAATTAAAGGWKVVRQSRVHLDAPLDESADVLLLDTIGELAGLYRLADAVFVGGSLVPAGGHNILEPAWFAKPPVFGPSMENFRDMATEFLKARAAVEVTSGQQLGKVWIQLIEDGRVRERMGRTARELSERNRGATLLLVERIAAVLSRRERSA
jgi:3-deoxy-D-manno-octulosonic-acid transferase